MTPVIRNLYLSQVRRHLTCSASSRQRLLRQGGQMVEDFLLENPGADESALAAAFGTHQEFAAQMLATLEPEEVNSAKRRRRLVKTGLITLVALALALTAVICFVKWKQAQTVVNGDFYVIQEPGHNVSEEEFDSLFPEAQKGE